MLTSSSNVCCLLGLIVMVQVLLPDGAFLASQITIHAGSYAGGVVGKGAWSYE
jgi:hypothetical protein